MKVSKKYQKINIEISNICNLQCSFCPEVVRTKKLMDLGLFKEIIRQVSPLTEQVCFHLMGDPLVHPNLETMIKICEDNKTQIFFVTNGIALKEKQAELLLSPAFRQVNFSLHSFNDNFPSKNPDQYLSRIFDFTEKALTIRPELYINYRLWNLQSPLGEKESNREMLQKICDRFEIKFDETIDVRIKKSFKIKNRLYFHFDTEFIWPSIDLPILGTNGTCYGLSSHFGILVDGTVVPCCLDKEGAIPLGNVATEPISQILNSPRAINLLKGFKQRKLVESLCQRCQYIERFNEASV